jgi:hypothetical protein
MGAGCGNGPKRYGQACEGECQECSEPQLRHEHADDEQRIRHLDVVERRLTATFLASKNKARFGGPCRF